MINEVKPFQGNHCESTTTGTLLNQIGIPLSEPMIFGLGEGLGFIFWNMKIMEFPFIGGRIKPDFLTRNVTKNLNLHLEVQETSSTQKAWSMVRDLLNAKKIVGLKLDCFHLEYFKSPIHFAGHYVAIYGYDSEFAYLVDTLQQGSLVKTSLHSLALARNEKGPMSSKNLFYTIAATGEPFDLKRCVIGAIQRNVQDYLNPPIANIGYKGILKLSSEIKKWFKNSVNIERDFCTTAMLMEKAGTGGALFRNLYRDFLKESFQLLHSDIISKAHQEFIQIADHWQKVASLFDRAGKTAEYKYIEEASGLLRVLSEQERNAMTMLSHI